MNNYLKKIVLLLVLIPMMGVAQENRSDDTFKRFFHKDMRKIDGIIPAYYDNSRYYIEIGEDLLDNDLLVSGVVVEGAGYGETSSVTDVITISKSLNANRLEVYKKFYSEMNSDKENSQELQRALENTSLQTSSFYLPIVSKGKDGKGYIIDVTRDITSGGDLFNFQNNPLISRAIPSRSFVDTVLNFKTGVKFISFFSQKEMNPMSGAKNSSSKVEWGIQVMPRNERNLRFADSRVGYLSRQYRDYGADSHSVKNVSFIERWTIEVRPEDVDKYKKGRLVTPKESITVYLNDNIPQKMKPYVKEAIGEWSKAFEKIGFKDVFFVKESTPMMVVAPNQITISMCDNSKESCVTISCPKTNEILGANIVLDNSMITRAMKEFLFVAGVNYPDVLKKPYSDEVRGEIVRSKVAYYMGRSLGLKDNLIASSAYSIKQLRNAKWVKTNGIAPSILDINLVNYVAQPEDKFELKDLFPKVSHYDYWAIEYGYKVFPDNKNENDDKKSLSSLLDKANHNPYLIYSDRKDDYRVAANDLSSNRVEAIELAVNNMIRLLPKLDEISEYWSNDAKYWGSYVTLFDDFKSNYINYTMPLFRDLGGVYFASGERLPNYLSPEYQSQVMRFAQKQLSPVAHPFLADKNYRQLSGNCPEDFMEHLGKSICGQLCSSFKQVCSTDGKLKGKCYGATHFIADINRVIFNDFDSNKPVSKLTKSYQVSFLGTFLTNCFNSGNVLSSNNNNSVNVIVYVKDLYSKFKELASIHGDIESRCHYEALASIVEKFLNTSSNEPQQGRR